MLLKFIHGEKDSVISSQDQNSARVSHCGLFLLCSAGQLTPSQAV